MTGKGHQAQKGQTLLMCPPTYYRIDYEINPWMKRARQSEPTIAQEQWTKLHDLLLSLGADVEIVPAVAGLPDMVFTANAGIAFEKRFIVSNFRHDVRKPEALHFERWFSDRTYEVIHLPPEHPFEGEGDLLACGGILFAGYQARSDIHSHRLVAEILGTQVLSVELVNPWFYHLDTCFCPLADGAAFYFPKAFDHYGQRVLEEHFPMLIPVCDEEAQRFACNAVVLDKDIVMNDGCPEISTRLVDLGFRVHPTPLGEFIKAGGSAKCLVLKIP